MEQFRRSNMGSLGVVGRDGRVWRSRRALSTNKAYRAALRHHVVSESVHNSVRPFPGNGPGNSKNAVPCRAANIDSVGTAHKRRVKQPHTCQAAHFGEAPTLSIAAAAE